MFDMCSHVAVISTRTYPNALTLRGPLNPLNKVFIYELQQRKKFIVLLIFACILEFALLVSKLGACTQCLNSVFSQNMARSTSFSFLSSERSKLVWPWYDLCFRLFVIVHLNGRKWYRSCWLQLNQFGLLTTSDFNSLIAFVQVLRLIIQFWKMVTGCNFKVGMIVKNLERLQQPWRWA